MDRFRKCVQGTKEIFPIFALAHQRAVLPCKATGHRVELRCIVGEEEVRVSDRQLGEYEALRLLKEEIKAVLDAPAKDSATVIQEKR